MYRVIFRRRLFSLLQYNSGSPSETAHHLSRPHLLACFLFGVGEAVTVPTYARGTFPWFCPPHRHLNHLPNPRYMRAQPPPGGVFSAVLLERKPGQASAGEGGEVPPEQVLADAPGFRRQPAAAGRQVCVEAVLKKIWMSLPRRYACAFVFFWPRFIAAFCRSPASERGCALFRG